MGPTSLLLCPEPGHLLHPGIILPPGPRGKAPRTAQDNSAASRLSRMGRAPQARLLCGNRRRGPVLGAEAPGWPVRKPPGPWVCSQGRLVGCALAASQETQNVPSQYSRSLWAGEPRKSQPKPCLGHLEGHKSSVFVQMPLCEAKKAGPIATLPSAPLHSTGPLTPPPADCDFLSASYLSFKKVQPLGVSLGTGQEEKGLF